MFWAFFARIEPAHNMAKPVCMRKTSVPQYKIQCTSMSALPPSTAALMAASSSSVSTMVDGLG